MKKVMVVSAHPDDTEIGMGGTVAKLSATGCTIVSVVLTDGRRSPNPFALSQEEMTEMRSEETKRAARILGVNRTIFFDLESISTPESSENAIRKLSEVIDSVMPEEIFTLHPELDRHPTHRLAGKISIDAIKRSHLRTVIVWAYEVWGLFNSWDRFEDITDQIGTKLKAIGEHKSQLAAIPYAEGITGLNRWRAVFADPKQEKATATFAEVFLKLKL
ncbi:PIG-L family deacetylase [bacterium]|nr:PIG-L family deacetylase [bacterium]MCI0616263.1 PIG-L family deacetylase [bacterium]